VVRGDLISNTGSFAVPVNQTVGDTISFITTDTPPPDCNQNGVDESRDSPIADPFAGAGTPPWLRLVSDAL
jgi:hypothetical protein